MKTNLKFIGIDVSKDTLEICILSDEGDDFHKIANSAKAITTFFKEHLSKSLPCHICIENTGKYGWVLRDLLAQSSYNFYLINPLHLKRSSGLTRGKNDKIDALRIAQFIKKNYDQLSSYTPPRQVIKSLQLLICERDYKVKQRGQLKAKNKAFKVINPSGLISDLTAKNEQLICQLTKQIKDLEKQIKQLIAQDIELKKLNKQLQTIPGVGAVLACNILVKTNEFKNITEPRKLACYAGVAPFTNTSGSSVFGKNKVSNFADKSLKKLLHLAAMSAVRLDNDLRVFYQRKVQEGKNKMSVLNAVRNKIIHIIFALVKNQTFYQNRLVTS